MKKWKYFKIIWIEKRIGDDISALTTKKYEFT